MSHGKPTRERVAHFNRLLEPYRGADDRRSAIQLAVSAAGFVGFWTAALWSLRFHWAWTAVLVVPTAGFLMRLFMIQHDCGHGSFFTSRRARDVTGFVIGVLTLTPYQYWRKTHAYHHAHSGDLDFRGFGDIDTLTVAEYRALPRLKRLGYRLYRNPLLLLTVGPAFHFLVKHRYPWDIPRDWTQAWRSVWWTNLALVAVVAALGMGLGWGRFLAVQLPVTLLTCSLGVLLFYVQHQFEDTYWHRHEEWDYFDAALEGSSLLALPRPLQWITANIGIHHVHHLNARIPNYRLEEVMEAHPEFQSVTRITLRDAWRLLRLSLWDEERGALIPFRALRTAAPVVLLALMVGCGGAEAQPSRAQVLEAAREVIAAAPFASLATVDEAGRPAVRVMDATPPDSAFVIWLATIPASRKVDHLRTRPDVALHWVDPSGPGYVTLVGRARLVEDLEEKRAHWKPSWDPFYATGVEGALLVEVVPLRLEIVSVRHGLEGDPETWRAEIVEFGPGGG